MSSSKDSTLKTLVVATLLCLVCSFLVSSVAVSLKELQAENKALEKKRNILTAAGLIQGKADNDTVRKTFEKVRPIVVDIDTGTEVDKPKEKGLDPLTYDQRKPDTWIEIPKKLDPNRLQKRARHAVIYLVENQKTKQIEVIILPVRGRGLWSTLYGFLALSGNTNTVKGLAYYEHGETPGLGGEVDNVNWKAQWAGKEYDKAKEEWVVKQEKRKKIYDKDWNIAIEVIKGKVDNQKPDAVHQVDGLSGATITTKGVSDSLRYWLGEHGFGPFLKRIREEQGVQ